MSLEHASQNKNTSPLADIERSPFVFPRTERWVLRSTGENRTYHIFVAAPQVPAPPSGYAVVFVLDANSVFATVAEAVRLQGRPFKKKEIVPAVVIGIGYDTEAPYSEERFYDFTPTADSPFQLKHGGPQSPPQGGAEAFLRFIEEELKPRVYAEFPVDRSLQLIFGHSLGGLFVLHTMFTKPEAFRYYIAGSPSIHWTKELMEEEEAAFAARLKENPQAIDLFMAMGELERGHFTRSVENAEELAERLRALKDCGLRAEYKEFEGENHGSILPVLISRSLRFAFDY